MTAARQQKLTEAFERLGIDIRELSKFRHHHTLGGRFLLDPDECCGWYNDGVYDQTLTTRLSSVGGNLSRASGGLCFPVPVKINRFFAWHYNSNADALPWGWRISRQRKVGGSNGSVTNDIWRQCVGTGATAIAPNDYGNTTSQLTDVDFMAEGFDQTIPAGEVVVLGVEAPTAIATNRFVFIMSGYISFEEVL